MKPIKVFRGLRGGRWHAFCRWCHKCIRCDQYWTLDMYDDAYEHLSEEHKDKMAAGGV